MSLRKRSGAILPISESSVATTEAGKRKLDTKVKLQGTGAAKRYRTCYLRLVVDEFDQGVKDPAGRKKQTLLVTDMIEAAQAETDKDKAAELRRVEILDQRVRARYVIDSCPQSDKKCRAEEVLVIGENHKRVEAAINILRAPANNKFDNAFEGTGVADIDVTRDWAMEFVRGIYAQADMGMKLVKHGIRYINAPANMFTVGARVTAGTPPETWTGVGAGPTAAGGSTMTVGVKVDGGTEETASITTVAGESPKKTVDRLAAEIKKKFPAVTIKTFENKRNSGQVGKTADILVGDPQTQKIELSIKALGEANHRCVVTRVTSTQIEEFRTHDSWVGTPQERILLYNYDEGKSHIDVFIVGTLDNGSIGEAFNPDFKESNADFRSNDQIVNSLMMEVAPIANDTFHTTLAHEMAHVLTDRGHIRTKTGSVRNTDQLLGAGSPVGSDEKVVKGPKHIGDPPSTAANSAKIDFSSTDRGSFVEFLRKTNPTLLTGWQATVALKDK
ncbi:MAG: hypothetical protein IID36_09090 [Planctomycetes bacterium]|nr:hypothetical protein [Planctomycetota bacterium]